MTTEFQNRVFAMTKKIPKGSITTYKILAQALGCKSAQAIGQALKRNPFAPQVPCHRVVATNLSIGGFKGQRAGPEIEAKIQLLKKEGVLFMQNGTINPGCVFKFTS